MLRFGVADARTRFHVEVWYGTLWAVAVLGSRPHRVSPGCLSKGVAQKGLLLCPPPLPKKSELDVPNLFGHMSRIFFGGTPKKWLFPLGFLSYHSQTGYRQQKPHAQICRGRLRHASLLPLSEGLRQKTFAARNCRQQVLEMFKAPQQKRCL